MLKALYLRTSEKLPVTIPGTVQREGLGATVRGIVVIGISYSALVCHLYCVPDINEYIFTLLIA